ncbi:hypothetical protein BMW23_0666 [Bodo saltans virus]|jgi:hypothetical protein|uniref:Uncharacterized protein n=1 Tax=Bodo saltans virus TaxID=2024608 RepID=A0A2H4UUW0_9VIRU|nr:hypothetical protein QJ851_gp0649 [Bodo saltans virus]ATZ80712.1 hypothetical protein BMW23_0666 [Bodo saltans virus]
MDDEQLFNKNKIIIMSLIREMYSYNKNFLKYSKKDIIYSYHSLRHNVIYELRNGNTLENIKCKLSIMKLWTREKLPITLNELDYYYMTKRSDDLKRKKMISEINEKEFGIDSSWLELDDSELDD